jgi:predicted ATPase
MLKIGEYNIVEKIYDGRNSKVYRVQKNTVEDLTFILKVINEEFPSSTQIARFKYEYQIMGELNSKRTPKAIEFLHTDTHVGILMEDIGAEGDLGLILTDKLDLSQNLGIAIQIADGLLAIKKAGIIHKDLKPQNIIYNSREQLLQIIDFGMSTKLSVEEQRLSGDEDLQMTLPYVSPEQTGRMNCTTDYRTDFYSFGILLYELFSGNHPFDASDVMGWVHCHIAQEAIPLDVKDPQIPVPISRMVVKLMSKNKEDRYQSVTSLLRDLKECQKKWTEQGQIDDFEIARADVSSNFHVSQRLYGREKEIEMLLSSFERVANGQDKIVIELVAGYSGVGKSALIHELNKPIAVRKGYFIEGKFDQFKSHIPFTGIAQAFGMLIRQLLKDPDVKLEEWKTRILVALGKNGKIITDIIPDLELVIGKQPHVNDLGGVDRLNRLNLMFEKFIGVFTKKEHPLVLFLDDLQWVDAASLAFLKSITEGFDTRYLLFIGAYRSNEVDTGHQFIKTVDVFRNQGISVNMLDLAPLSLSAIEQLVMDSLHSNAKEVKILCEILIKKTEGNPFFLSQFLKMLNHEGLLEFDYENVRWKWDVKRIKSLEITDNVVDLMLSRLLALPKQTQKLLGLAACIGNKFDLSLLMTIAKTTAVTVVNQLWPAIEIGVLLSEGEGMKIIRNMPEQATNNSDQQVSLRFLHDRVQQASYQLIAQANKGVIHYEIGKLLMTSFSQEQQERHCFDLADHINKGKHLIQGEKEMKRLIELNLTCGLQAIASAAYSSAVTYLNHAKEIIPDGAWERWHELVFSVHLELTKALYLSANYELAERIYPDLLKHAQTKGEKLTVYILQMEHYNMVMDLGKGLEVGLKGVLLFGIQLSTDEAHMQKIFLKEFDRIETNISGRTMTEIETSADMIDEDMKLLMSFSANLVIIAYMLGKINLWSWLGAKMTNLSLEHGHHYLSGYSYVNYGLILCSMGDLQKGNKFGELGMRISTQFDEVTVERKSHFGYGMSVGFYSHSIEKLVPILENAYQMMLKAGDTTFAVYCTVFVILYRTQFSLKEAHRASQDYLPFLKRFVPNNITFYVHGWHLVEVLMAIPKNEQVVEMDLSRFVAESEHNPSALGRVFPVIITLSYLKKEYLSLDELNEKVNIIQMGIAGQFAVLESYFYASISLLAIYNKASIKEQKESIKLVADYQQKIKFFADNCEANFLHKYLLIEAEKNRVLQGDFEITINLYEQAIKLAKAHKFLGEEAIATACFGEFWLGKDKREIAAIYLRQACYLYDLWGAKLLVIQMQELYPDIFDQMRVTDSSQVLHTTSSTNFGTASSGSISETIDINTLIKASHSISSEVQLNRLLSKLMRILIENAGAQQGLLLLLDDQTEELRIQAAGIVGQEPHMILSNLALDDKINVAHSVVKYVHRSLENVMLGDAAVAGNFTDDTYFQKNQSKSVMCIPLLNQTSLIGE